ncbi:hypothetical protein P154DRAFT_580169 [Amniculicola lignicola CBS 123094]|uniref:Uncharacterized protein n=1 Tax=Amniculicola lignicola CBS 123094 TaxID=1392246 RepID=A0A6A5W561_9PLEO|nr:hypothetical protein P154DRAFT_580169 [Amniculicola lignicola CBS 123094]
MPPWGRPLGGRGGVGRYMEEPEDVYRFQELDTDDEKNGVMAEPGFQGISNNKPLMNPDELYFSDMDPRAWERRTGVEVDPSVYGEDYGYQEDEGYYEDGGGVPLTHHVEYEEFLFQRVLDKIRLARATGDPDVQLSQEELDAYQNRLLRPRAPATRPPARVRQFNVPVNAITPPAITPPSIANASSSAASSTRSRKPQQRMSFFGSSRSKKEKERPTSRKRAPSNVSETTNSPAGFVVAGPNGQPPVHALINAYNGRLARDAPLRSAASPSRTGSRSASVNSRQAATPPRVTPPRDMPGGFPPGSPQMFHRDPTPPRQGSSSSRLSALDNADWQLPPNNRSRSSPNQQPAKLVPFPVTDYQHYSAEPYQYYTPEQPKSSQTSSQPQFVRRVVSNAPDGNFMTMPRRVPVPVQRAGGPMQNVQGSYSDPALGPAGRSKEETSEDDEGEVMVDGFPQADDKNYKIEMAKTPAKSGSSSSPKDSEKRRRSVRTSSRRKH